VSFFSSHGSIDHLFALIDLVKKEGVKDVFIHAMLAGGENCRRAGQITLRRWSKKLRRSTWEKWSP